MTVHLFRANDQPATRYKLDLSTIKDGIVTSRFHTITNPRQRVFRCFKCRRNHYAKNMIVNAYYDGSYYFCKDGTGCRSKGR